MLLVGKVLTVILRQLDLSLTIIYCLCILFIKLSILQLYLRISPDGKFRATVYLVIAIVVGYNLGSAPMNLFSCDPIARTWDFSISVGSSINRPVFYFANAGLNIGTDLIMIVLPILMLRNLHLPMGQKDGLIGIFMAGSLYATLQTLLEGLTNIRHSYCEMCLSRAIPDSQRCQKRIPSACSGLRDLARSEQQQLKSKDGNGKCLCRDSDVEYAVLSASAMDAFGDLNIVALRV
jgi:hypothetical protein